MNTITLLESLTKYAELYRSECAESVKRNSHMNQASGDAVKQCDIDAILVDFINFIGMRNCVDYALYTMDILPEHAPQENKE